MTAPRRNPYVVGQWVRGERFYGRRSMLKSVLESRRSPRWILGTRRIGKTSLLRQIELVAGAPGDPGRVPLFWDLQGSDSRDELRSGLQDALLDAEERLAEHGIDAESLEVIPGTIAVVERLERELRRRGERLLLLVDEAEELLSLRRSDPSLVRRLGALIAGADGVATVLASSVRLREMADELPGLLPPLSLGPLGDEAARELVLQTGLPADLRPEVSEETAADLCRRCGNHPYLLQLLAKRLFELGDLDRAEASVADDRMVARFLEVDFQVLDPAEQRLLRRLAEGRDSSAGETTERREAGEAGDWLLALGLAGRSRDGGLELPNPLFRGWLAAMPSADPAPAEIGDDDVSRLSRVLSARALSRVGDRELTAQRLMELVYDELRDLAGRYMWRERREHTLQPTALVHEAYLKLADQSRVDWQGRTHFLAVGAQAMRRILIDHARGRGRVKRGGEWLRVPLLEELLASARRGLDSAALLDLDRAVDRLADTEPRQARVVELRFFAGLEVAEVAEVLGVSKRTVEGDWARARDRLRAELTGDGAEA